MSSPTNGFASAIQDNESLVVFVRKMKEFDKAFCDSMAKGDDFTIRLEIRGNKGELLHGRLYIDVIDRPRGAQKRIDGKEEVVRESVAETIAAT